MNYNKIYDKIIEKYGSKDKPKGFYTERHHILPKSIGGSNDKENLVYLKARYHYVCHRLLVKIYPNENKLKFAFWAMCNQLYGDVTREYKVTSHAFEKAKVEFVIANSKLHKGKKMSPEWCKALSERMKGNTINPKGELNHLYGKPRSQEVINKIKETIRNNPTRNSTFKGMYITPYGTFYSAIEAEKITGFSQWFFRRMCLEPNKPVSGRTLCCLALSKEDSGKTPRELGYWLEASSNS